jgi:muramidase (phage lysozyme)
MTRGAFLTSLAVLSGGLLLYRNHIQTSVSSASIDSNVSAFLRAIRHSEGTSGPNGYRTLYGGALFSDYSNHPYLTGEWNGAALPAQWCANAGYSSGCITTAAGAYQITKSTWLWLKPLLGLNDFSPANQDLAAIELIDIEGALDDVIAGDIVTAMDKVKNVWASIPGSFYGQPTATQQQWLAWYQNAGGAFV